MMDDEKASSQWYGMFYDQKGRSPTEEEFSEWMNKRDQSRKMRRVSDPGPGKRPALGAPQMKVENGPLDISMNDLGKAGANATEDLSNTRLKSNSNFAKLFDIDTRFLKRDFDSIGKAFNDVFKDKPKFKRVKNTAKHAVSDTPTMGEVRRGIRLAENADTMKGAIKTDFKKIGNTLVNELGEGNKLMGAGKLGAYAVGALALVDFLNPFDDD